MARALSMLMGEISKALAEELLVVVAVDVDELVVPVAVPLAVPLGAVDVPLVASAAAMN